MKKKRLYKHAKPKGLIRVEAETAQNGVKGIITTVTCCLSPSPKEKG